MNNKPLIMRHKIKPFINYYLKIISLDTGNDISIKDKDNVVWLPKHKNRGLKNKTKLIKIET